MKSRFTALDVRAAVTELSKQVDGMRLQNIYDASPVNRAYLLKFSKTDAKLSIVIESGTRIHGTTFTHEKPNMIPSGFAAKLRKHLRGRRVSLIEQLGFDRVVHFQFGSDFDTEEARQEHEFHLYLELFSLGNIILTNWQHQIIALLRPVELVNEGKKVAVGQVYEPTAFDLPESLSESTEWEVKSLSRGPLAAFSPQMMEFCLERAELHVKKTTIIPEAQRSAFCSAVQEIVAEIKGGATFAGYINLNPSTITPADLLKPETEVELLSFSPLSFGATTLLHYSSSFNDAVDIYFSRLEAQKALQKLKNSESEAERKLAAIQAEQQSRIAGLEASIELLLKKAQAVEGNAEMVEAALVVGRTALESGMDWTDFARLIESEKKSTNAKRAAVAALFAGLNLKAAQVSLKLDDLVVELNVRDSAFGNASRLYELRSQAKAKMDRTIAVYEAAMKSAAAKIKSEAAVSRKMGRVRQLQALRKPFWFEKFSWFVSTEGFLVLAGRDAQQNEVLVKKYLRPGDAYVHADVHGAGSIVVKNHLYPTLSTPPPKTLHEAGNFSICASRAWEAKIVTSAWWVRAEQVSKTAPSGEYLGTGSFMIRGSKNFLPPMQLSLSFGFVFVVDEEARAAKKAERLANEKGAQFAGEDVIVGEKYRVEEMTHAVEALIIDTSAPKEESHQKAASKKEKNQNKKAPIEEVPTKSEQGKASNRGKKGKEKKIKKKYANQDEEERELRMQLLGSAKKKPVPEPEAKQKAKKEPAEVKEAKQPKKPKAEIEAAEEEEDVDASIGEYIASDYFTLTPEDDKEYFYALPVCYPTSAFTSARFRVKLIPGNLKKGKAVKSAVSLLTEASSCPSQHLRDLMRAVPENEMLTVMPAKVALGVSAHETSKLKKKKPNKKTAGYPGSLMDRFLCDWPECGRSFTKPSKLAEHRRSHTNERIFVCQECGKSFLRNGHLKRHHLSAHTDSRPFKCTFEGCEATFALKHHLTRHEKTHLNEKSYACTVEGCQEAFAKHIQLRQHMCQAHKGEPTFKCESCGLGFDSRSRYKRHQKTAHSGKIYMCGHEGCFQTFSKWSEVVAHRKAEHKRVLHCAECGKSSFKSEKAYKQHLKSHYESSDEKAKHFCPQCGKDFTSRNNLKAHVQAVHLTTMPFACTLCDAAYGYKKLLQKHMAKVHNSMNQEELPMTVSPQELTEAFSLEAIVGLDYVTVREIICPVESCKRRFMRQYDLDRHLESTHSVLEYLE